MQRETLEAIFNRAPGIERRNGANAPRFVPVETHDLSVYLGRPGAGMAVQNVLAAELLDTHVELEVKDRGTVLTSYECVAMVVSGTRKERSGRGGVGF